MPSGLDVKVRERDARCAVRGSGVGARTRAGNVRVKRDSESESRWLLDVPK